MSENNVWKKIELYFYFEFVEDLSVEKKQQLEKSIGYYYIPNDFTIYQNKSYPFDVLNETDFHINQATFIWMLYNLHIPRVKDLIKFHFDKFSGEKIDFLEYVFHELAGSKLSQGNIQLPPPQQKIIVMEWCQAKLNEIRFENKKPEPNSNKVFISVDRIISLREINNENFDFQKLIRLLEEINHNYSFENFLSVAILSRAVIDHIPPIFSCKTFNEVANNYGNTSFKKNMQHLNNSMRSMADSYLHVPIRRKESLPNENQINFSREIDFLLAEIIRIQ
ncbi:hypothetical protein [Flavobacterium sp.]|uniref:hypothetical protein n=1 Tax=Flavobacterium sp. TaxID=239 RepID=UPI0039E3A797